MTLPAENALSAGMACLWSGYALPSGGHPPAPFARPIRRARVPPAGPKIDRNQLPQGGTVF